jgi:SNF2 family DNA or RNA helicase
MLVVKEHKKLLLNLNDPNKVTTVIPTAQVVTHKGNHLVAVPHRMDEVRVLRNLGFDAPAPMRYYYDWPGRFTPFEHQRITSEFLTMNPKSFCLNGMGSGKTLSGLWAFDFLRKQGIVRKLLVLAPLSTLERTWGDEIFLNFPDLTFAVLHGTRERRHKLLAEDFDIYIINHDGIKAKETLDLLCTREGLDAVIVDEIASFRNARTERFKALKRLVDKKEFVWGFTGTPTPNDPTDAWAQCRLICPHKVPKYFGQWQEMVMRPLTPFKKVARDTALDQVRAVMQPSVRFSREDCIDLPPTTYVTREAPLTDEQKKAFKDMLTKLKTEIGTGQISAVNEAAKLTKLVQIGCGVAYDKNGESVVIPAKPRMELCKEIIEESAAKVIVFVPLTGALETLAAELRKDFTVEIIHGATPRAERDRILKAFQSATNPRVLVANPATMSHGLTLTAADTIVWFAPINSNEMYEQANARIVRPGQKRNTLIVHIESTDVERKMYQRLQRKGRMQGVLLEMLKGANE